MAGTFTHYMICSQAITQIQQSEIRDEARTRVSLGAILGAHKMYLYLGCASPDIPYLGSADWAAKLHNDSTNGIVNLGMKRLQNDGGLHDDEAKAKWVWLLGYLSHIIADTIVHPVVNMIVGDYINNKNEHRICEMVQDSFVYRLCKNVEITYSEYHDRFRQCQRKHFAEIMSLWKDLSLEAYPRTQYANLSSPAPNRWTRMYIEAMDSIEGGSGPFALFRHLEMGPSYKYAYRTTEELLIDHPEWVNKYYAEVPVPNREGKVCFQEVVDHAVQKCVMYWTDAYNAIMSSKPPMDIVSCIDLDTGMIIGATDGRLPMWEA